jgi:hypothetical protein
MILGLHLSLDAAALVWRFLVEAEQSGGPAWEDDVPLQVVLLMQEAQGLQHAAEMYAQALAGDHVLVHSSYLKDKQNLEKFKAEQKLERSAGGRLGEAAGGAEGEGGASQVTMSGGVAQKEVAKQQEERPFIEGAMRGLREGEAPAIEGAAAATTAEAETTAAAQAAGKGAAAMAAATATAAGAEAATEATAAEATGAEASTAEATGAEATAAAAAPEALGGVIGSDDQQVQLAAALRDFYRLRFKEESGSMQARGMRDKVSQM